MTPKTGGGFLEFFGALNRDLVLETQDVYIIPTKKVIRLFSVLPQNAPDWWHRHDKSRQNAFADASVGSTENALYALAVLYALHYFAPFY